MPTNNYSIVDYLSSQGQPTDFESRKRKYEGIYGGEYRGTAEQNVQFLKGLQTPASVPQISTAVSPQTSLTADQLIAQSKAMLAQTAAEGSKPFFGSSYDVPPITAQQIQGQAQNQAAVPQQFTGVIPPQKQMTAVETLAAVRQQPGVQLAEKAAGLDKESIARQIAAAKGTTAQKAAASGVVFSPAFYDQPLAALDAEKVAKDLNVDISVARIITSAMQEEQNAQLKEATAGQKAIEAYYKTQGKQINPMTGALEDIPMTEAEKRAETKLTLSEEAGRRAQEGLNLTLQKFAQQGEIDESEIDSLANLYNKNKVITEIPSALRGQVITRAKEIATEDLNSDIQEGIGTRNLTPEVLIPQLQSQYPEFSPKEITDTVNRLLPTIQKSQVTETKSFWQRLFGK